MPLQPGDKRIGVTYNPATGYITPDVPLQKESDPTHIHELARILDLLGEKIYVGVVWVGQMLETSYFPDDSNNLIAGYLSAPFNTLNDGYVAACSRYGTPGSGSKVAVICVEANTAETKSVQLCSSYVDIYGIGDNTISGPPGLPVFTSCAASGMTVQGLDFIANGAPVLSVSPTEPLTYGMTFEGCSFSNIGVGISQPTTSPQGLLDIRSPLAAPVVLKECYAALNDRPLLYFDPDENNVPLVLDISETVLEVNAATNIVFQALDYLGVRLTNCEVRLARDGASLFSTYSNSGSTYTDITGLRIRNDDITLARPLKLIDSARYNTVYWEEITSDALAILNVSSFVDANLIGDILDSRFTSLSLANVQMTLANLRLSNIVGDIYFNVAAATPSTELVNIRTLTPLASTADTRALLSSGGAVAAKLFNCNVTYRLFTPLNGTGVFCGLVIGGSSYGLSRLVCLGNPVRQCIIRQHVLHKQDFYTNNSVSSTYYPDLSLAGITPNDVNYPILIQGVNSQGFIDAEVADLTVIPNRYAYITNSTFTAHDAVTQPWFPSIPPAYNPPADQRIFISAGGRYPLENSNVRDTGLRSWTYVQRIANRFGPLYLGDSSQVTILEGSSFSVSNPRALRNALNVDYTTLYVRLPGGALYVDAHSPESSAWTVLSMVADAGLDNAHLRAVSDQLPMVYSYASEKLMGTVANYAALPTINVNPGDIWITLNTGQGWCWQGRVWSDLGIIKNPVVGQVFNRLRISVPEPVLEVDHLDFVISSLNAPEDASIPVPVTTLDVTQAGKVSIPVGVTSVVITFSPAFTTVPVIITDLLVPSGQPDINIEVSADSVSNIGFTALLPGGPLSVSGYFISYIAATTS